MDPDLLLVIGLVLGILSIPSVLSAISDSRTPRAASIILLISGVLIVVALNNKSGGYAINQIPDVFVRVIARYLG